MPKGTLNKRLFENCYELAKSKLFDTETIDEKCRRLQEEFGVKVLSNRIHLGKIIKLLKKELIEKFGEAAKECLIKAVGRKSLGELSDEEFEVFKPEFGIQVSELRGKAWDYFCKYFQPSLPELMSVAYSELTKAGDELVKNVEREFIVLKEEEKMRDGSPRRNSFSQHMPIPLSEEELEREYLSTLEKEYKTSPKHLEELLSFIEDQELRKLIKQDLREAIISLRLGLTKAPMVLAGAVLEGILFARLIKEEKYGSEEERKKLREKDLDRLISECSNLNILPGGKVSFYHTVRKFRNYIHPGRQLREEEKLDYHSAKIACQAIFQVLEEFYEELKNK